MKSAVATSEVYFNFFMKVLKTIAESKSNSQQAYLLLQDNLDKLNDNFASWLRNWATAKMSRIESKVAQAFAMMILDFSNLIAQFSLGSIASNKEIAIAGYEAVETVFTREKFPKDWATTQINMANVYGDRIKGDKPENLESAIRLYQAVLQVHTSEDFPQDLVATIQNNLAVTYRDRIKGDKAENLEKAIAYCKAALEIWTSEKFREYWAMIQNTLGEIYRERIKGDKDQNLEDAIDYYKAALEVHTRKKFPKYWAMSQNNLAVAYLYRIKGDKSENLELAIRHYQAALEVRTREKLPEYWARTKHNLAGIYINRIKGDKIENLEKAIGYFQNALEVRTREEFPQGWAASQHSLGEAYRNRIKGDKGKNLTTAIIYYQAALEVYIQEKFPQDCAETLYCLGLAYQETNQKSLAYDTLAKAIEIVEFLREEIISGDESKQKLAEKHNQVYQIMVEVCLDMVNYTAAIEYAERSKTRNLVEQILTRDLHNIFPPNVVKELEKLRDEIASYQNQIQTGKADNPETLALHLVQLRQQRNNLQNRYLPIGSSFKFDHFQVTLDDHTAIIEWYITGESFHTFIFTRHSPQPFVLSATADDRNALVYWAHAYLKDYYEQKDNWRIHLTPRLQELAKILHLDEILAHLPKDCQQLILIPHRYLHLFPLHALPVGELCLLDIFPKGVSYAPSCQLLLQAQKRKRPDFTNLFAIQNPTKDRPYVDFGVEAIRPHFQPNDYVLPGDKAIKANLIQSEQLRSAHCFHFFGHATFNFEKSALILADGHLTLGEIFALDLNQCRLVILSACETGMTDFNSISDEYIGLPSGFLFAGSPSVVSTLWEVDQLSAAFLMIEFYENLRKYKQLEEGDIAIALNLSQKRLRDLTVDEFKKRLVQYKPLIDEILSKLPKVERRKAEASITYRLSQAYPFAHPSDWAAFTATGI